MRVVLLEDDARLCEVLRRGLVAEGIAVEVLSDGVSGLERLKRGGFDVAVIDVMMPRLDGISAIAAARAARVRAPLLLLSARDGVDDRVRGLDAGADDYLVKPFAFAELLARLRALVRRGEIEPEGPLRVGELTIDSAHKSVSVRGAPLELSPTETGLLAALARRAGEAVSRRELLRAVWGYQFDPGTNVIDVHIHHLRRRLDAADAGVKVLALRGVGYRLVRTDETDG